jgi:hypothetical protein
MSVKNIINGWSNFIFPNEEIEALAYKRAEICFGCPENKQGDLLVRLNDKLENIKGNYCDLCGCPLSPKVRSENEKCDNGKW